MATATVCDRCRKELLSTHVTRQAWQIISHEGHLLRDVGREYCIDCQTYVREAVEKLFSEKI